MIRDHEIALPGLPPELDGTVLVQLSDIHLNGLISRSWLEKLVFSVNNLRPDLIVVVGDVVDGEAEQLRTLAAIFGKLRAPLGIWAVTGNHEYYAGIERCVQFLKDAGCTVLRDASAQAAPGLVLAGVDDLGARQQYNISTAQAVADALGSRPPGATIYLCHTPIQAKTAAAAGAGLMLCGHTHNGQIWPFTYLVKLRYPLIGGRYEIRDMPLIVCRGTGTWGPRMRLWLSGEVIRVKLGEARGPQKLNQ